MLADDGFGNLLSVAVIQEMAKMKRFVVHTRHEGAHAKFEVMDYSRTRAFNQVKEFTGGEPCMTVVGE